MAGMLPKTASQFHKIPQARIALLGSMWHGACVEGMIARAEKELLAVDVSTENILIHHVPGSLELPFAARVLFEQDSTLDAIIAFGVVLQGATSHADTVIRSVSEGFASVSERYFKPIINEVIAVDTIDDAVQRSGSTEENKGLEAVFAVTELLHWVSEQKPLE